MSEIAKDSGHEDRGHVLVEIFMNEPPPFKIHRGHQTVAAIKDACRVPVEWVIELVQEDQTLLLLSNEGSRVIKGGEHFVSHVPSGGSS